MFIVEQMYQRENLLYAYAKNMLNKRLSELQHPCECYRNNSIINNVNPVSCQPCGSRTPVSRLKVLCATMLEFRLPYEITGSKGCRKVKNYRTHSMYWDTVYFGTPSFSSFLINLAPYLYWDILKT